MRAFRAAFDAQPEAVKEAKMKIFGDISEEMIEAEWFTGDITDDDACCELREMGSGFFNSMMTDEREQFIRVLLDIQEIDDVFAEWEKE